MQGVQGTNRGGEVNNRIFSRKMCGGSNCNGSFVKQFVDGDRVLRASSNAHHASPSSPAFCSARPSSLSRRAPTSLTRSVWRGSGRRRGAVGAAEHGPHRRRRLHAHSKPAARAFPAAVRPARFLDHLRVGAMDSKRGAWWCVQAAEGAVEEAEPAPPVRRAFTVDTDAPGPNPPSTSGPA